MEPLLAIEGLGFGYRGRPRLFSGLDLRVCPGELVGLIGPNGAGKTTLLELARGGLKPASGSVRLLGDDPRGLSPAERARRVACLLQRPQAPGASTVFDIVLGGRRPYRDLGGFSAEDEELALEAARRLGVEPWLERRGSELSGGEYQRVLLARVVAQGTPLLLCDEPASSLDPKHLWATFRLLKSLAREDGAAVLASVHDLPLAAAFCDRVVLLAEGRLCYDGGPEGLTDGLLSEAYGLGVRTVKTEAGIFFAYE